MRHEIEYLEGSFLEPDIVEAALDGVDGVCHLASTTVPFSAAADPVRDVRENLIGSLSLLQVMRSTGVRRLIFLSSGGTVYGMPQTLPIAESHPLRPISSYGIVKAAIEAYIDEMHRAGWLEPTVLRLANPYGPRQSAAGVQGVIASFMNKIQASQALEIWGDGTVIRDYIYVTDAADAVVQAITKRRCGVFNIGSGNGISLNELIATIRRVCNRTIEVHYSEARSIDVPANYLNVSRARDVLGWRCAFSLEEGLAQTWAWVNSRGMAF
jgi:UDP-glucose 4-epimerase